MNNKNNVSLGDGVADEFNDVINNELKKMINKFIPRFFVFVTKKIEKIPEIAKRLQNNSEMELEIEKLWSEYLWEEGIVPKGYSGLSDKLLVSNFKQEGYLTGIYVGYVIAMMALVDNGATKEMVCTVRDYMHPYLIKNRYDNSNEFIDRYKAKYRWVENLTDDK